ncbi:FKBP-type peptidyl-prolyl cis-trans isomerase [Actinoplanes friuliensis]|jgi:peptidylprolyl isomerase|uniref:Peptidyl-prolyl cis-trans isomerase n=1 Tax=Actinoplanes friuliensis DSM 7358 TaxID=1246995 RepID=U5W1Y6_9ACTN|nr:FKBP-type peptidyl-prolyl cis-trans isomerase [Actinoplanes friuliensis]AGZ43238.1 FKBP-type peptidylprolyl isomerase [Actinoplanes friuliensis DSM 7358]
MSVQDKTGTSRRGQALTGAFAGVAVIAVLVAVYIGIQVSDDDETTPAAAPAASAPAQPPAEAPAEPAPSQPAPAAPAQVDPALQKPPVIKAGKGAVKELLVTPVVAGKGPKVQAGQTITANYVGVTYKDGKEFDSSWKTGQPVQFPVGAGQLIEGWDKGLVGVPVGSRVQLDIPAAMAYGEQAQGGRPSGDLRFVVDVLAAQ